MAKKSNVRYDMRVMERLFLAINLPQEVKSAVRTAQTQMKAQMRRSKITWADPDQCHITLHFLGGVQAGKRDQLVAALRAGSYPKPFTLALSQVSAFPSKKQPRTLFVETTSHPSVRILHMRMGAILANLGFEVDPRPWLPHLTIGRVHVQSEVLKPEEIPVQPVRFAVTAFALMRSMLSPEGSRYETVEEFIL